VVDAARAGDHDAGVGFHRDQPRRGFPGRLADPVAMGDAVGARAVRRDGRGARIGYVGPTVDRPHFSALGILAVQRRPELYQAYIGAAQAVDLTDSDRSQYADMLAWVRAKGDTDLVKQLTAVGPPPYGNLYAYAPMLLNEAGAFAYPGGIDSGSGQMENFDVNEHSLLDKVHVFSGFLDCYGLLYLREKDVDLRARVTSLGVAAYFLEGEHDVPGRLMVMRPWYDAAPGHAQGARDLPRCGSPLAVREAGRVRRPDEPRPRRDGRLTRRAGTEPRAAGRCPVSGAEAQ
jgi:hypothetical protein